MPLDSEHRRRRRDAILEILKSRAVGSQKDLLALLRERGIEANQSSVSRDLRGLRASRVGGIYEIPVWPPPAESELDRVRGFIRTAKKAGPNYTLITTQWGVARLVARALDQEKWPEVVGTVASESSFLILTPDAAAQKQLFQRLKGLMPGS